MISYQGIYNYFFIYKLIWEDFGEIADIFVFLSLLSHSKHSSIADNSEKSIDEIILIIDREQLVLQLPNFDSEQRIFNAYI